MSKTGKYVSGASALLGVWLAFSVLFVFGTESAHFWNDVIVGGAILVLAGYNFVTTDEYESVTIGVSLLVGLLGAWTIIAAVNFTVAGTTGDLLFWSDALTGGLVFLLSAYNIYQGRFVSIEEEAEEASYR